MKHSLPLLVLIQHAQDCWGMIYELWICCMVCKLILVCFILCRQRLQMQQRRRSKLTFCNTSSGVLMFFASNEEGTFLGVFYSLSWKQGRPFLLGTRQDLRFKQIFVVRSLWKLLQLNKAVSFQVLLLDEMVVPDLCMQVNQNVASSKFRLVYIWHVFCHLQPFITHIKLLE